MSGQVDKPQVGFSPYPRVLPEGCLSQWTEASLIGRPATSALLRQESIKARLRSSLPLQALTDGRRSPHR